MKTDDYKPTRPGFIEAYDWTRQQTCLAPKGQAAHSTCGARRCNGGKSASKPQSISKYHSRVVIQHLAIPFVMQTRSVAEFCEAPA